MWTEPDDDDDCEEQDWLQFYRIEEGLIKREKLAARSLFLFNSLLSSQTGQQTELR